MLVVAGRPSGSVTCALTAALARLPGPRRFVSDAALAPSTGAAPVAGFEYVRAAAGAPDSIAGALAGATELILLPRFERSTSALECALAAAARDAGVHRIAQVSLIGADPRSPVELLRLIGSVERAVGASGVPHTIYRTAPFIQALAHFLRARPDQLELVGPFRTAPFAWIDACDVGEIVARDLEQPESAQPASLTTQLCGDELLDFDGLAAQIAAGTGRPCEYHDVSPPAAYGMLEAQGMPPAAARALIEYWDYIVSGVVCTTPCDNARKLLGRPLKRVTETFEKQTISPGRV